MRVANFDGALDEFFRSLMQGGVTITSGDMSVTRQQLTSLSLAHQCLFKIARFSKLSKDGVSYLGVDGL